MEFGLGDELIGLGTGGPDTELDAGGVGLKPGGFIAAPPGLDPRSPAGLSFGIPPAKRPPSPPAGGPPPKPPPPLLPPPPLPWLELLLTAPT